ncbi:MAG: hypothetical protein U0103_25210 [Candidatus Obscuribacterales bacterium]|nr:MAG: hypothetical protein EKK48_29040 [Candidatus Melainabacteria bacterium]
MSKRNSCFPLLVLLSILSFASAGLFQSAEAKSKAAQWHPGNYIYCTGLDPTDEKVQQMLDASPRFRGVQVLYTWRSCEPTKNGYDFSKIKRHLRMAKLANKHLFVQVQFKGFGSNPYEVCPNYLVNGSPKPGGGYYSAFYAFEFNGKLIRQPASWDPVVQARLLSFLNAMANALKSDPNVSALEAVNLPETASGTVTESVSKAMPKSVEVYNNNLVERFKALNAALPHTQVMQFINWVTASPSFANREASMVQKAIADGVGIGGPDLRPWDASLAAHSYANIPMAVGKVPVGYAVQYPDTHHPIGGGSFADDTIENVKSTYKLAKDLRLNYVFWFGTNNYLNMVKEVLDAPAVRTDPAGGLVKAYPTSITPYLN